MKFSVLSMTAIVMLGAVAIPAQADVPCPAGSGESLCLAQRNRRYRNRWERNDDYYYYDINQIYREVLGREADSNGLETYRRRLERGDSLREVREDIAESREARDRVRQIYQQFIGRNPSDRTVRGYTRRLVDGWTLSDVRADIINSNEFRDRNRNRRPSHTPPPGVPYPGQQFPGQPPMPQPGIPYPQRPGNPYPQRPGPPQPRGTFPQPQTAPQPPSGIPQIPQIPQIPPPPPPRL